MASPELLGKGANAAMLGDGRVEREGASFTQLRAGRHAAGDALRGHELAQLRLHIFWILPVPPARQPKKQGQNI